MKTTKTTMFGLLAGATAGALLGVLLAPGKGSETRGKIKDKGREFTEGLKDKSGGFINWIKGNGSDLHQEVDNQVATGKGKFGKLTNDAKNTAM
jgi:gas vesicle protein